jgi:hypothetical protein
MYFQQSSSNLAKLEKLLTAALDRAKDLVITDEIIWLSIELGELRNRLEKADGLSLIDKGLNIFIKKNKNPRFTPDKKGLVDYIFSDYLTNNSFVKKFNKSSIVWGTCYLMSGESEDFINHAMKMSRLLSSTSDIYSSLRVRSDISGFITSNIIQSQNAFTNSITNSFISNVLVDLSRYVGFKAYQDFKIADKEYIENLISIINDSYLENEIFVYSIEKLLVLQADIEIALYLNDSTNEVTYKENIHTIKSNLLMEGCRGYSIEAISQLALSEKFIENSKYKEAIVTLTNAFNASMPLEESQKDIIQKIQLLKLLNLSLSGYDTNSLMEELLKLNNSRTKGLGIYYLVIDSVEKDNSSKRTEYTEIAEQTFFKMYGGVPRYARPLLAKWKSWSAITAKTLTGLPSWLIDYDALPKKVVSTKDGKIMQLVEPGIQWTKEGKEVWLWPFYIDEKPMTKKEIKLYAEEANYQTLDTVLKNGCSISVPSYTAYRIAKWAGKSLPSKQEAFAAYIQLEHKIMPENWHDINSLLKGMLKRIEHSVKLGETINIPCSGKPRTQPLEVNNTEEGISETLLNQLGNLDIKSFYSAEWLSNNKYLKDNYKLNFLQCFRELHFVDKHVQNKLSVLLVISLSLDYQEKKRILKLAKSNSLSQFQCDELIKTFEEEKTKFYGLAKEHPEHIVKRIKKCLSEFFSLINILDVSESIDPWHIYVSVRAHTDYWLNEMNQEPSIGSILLNHKNVDTSLPALRFVRPIFTKSDMQGLEEIKT